MPALLQRTVLSALLVCFSAQHFVAEELTVMSYNVENMFDVFDDPYTDDDGTDVKRRDEIAAIAQAIAHADADIIVFQELENEHLLQGMVDTFLVDKGYNYVACQRTNSSRGINLGVISRVPITRLASHRYLTLRHPDDKDQTWRFARDAMQVTVEVEGQHGPQRRGVRIVLGQDAEHLAAEIDENVFAADIGDPRFDQCTGIGTVDSRRRGGRVGRHRRGGGHPAGHRGDQGDHRHRRQPGRALAHV